MDYLSGIDSPYGYPINPATFTEEKLLFSKYIALLPLSSADKCVCVCVHTCFWTLVCSVSLYFKDVPVTCHVYYYRKCLLHILYLCLLMRNS